MKVEERRSIMRKIKDSLDNKLCSKVMGKTIARHHTELYADGRSEEWIIFTDGKRLRYPREYEEFINHCIFFLESAESADDFLKIISPLKEELGIGKD